MQSDICEGKGNGQGHVFTLSFEPKDNHFASEAGTTPCLLCASPFIGFRM